MKSARVRMVCEKSVRILKSLLGYRQEVCEGRVVREKCSRVLKSLPGYRQDSRLRRGRAFSRGNFYET